MKFVCIIATFICPEISTRFKKVKIKNNKINFLNIIKYFYKKKNSLIKKSTLKSLKSFVNLNNIDISFTSSFTKKIIDCQKW